MIAALAADQASDDTPSFHPFKSAPSMTELGRRLRQARRLRGYSQQRVAHAVGVAKQTISNWETAEAPPGLASLVRIAAVLDVDPGDFFRGLSKDLEMAPRGPANASRLIPLYAIETAGGILMNTIEAGEAKPERHIQPLEVHAPNALAFTVRGNAMADRFVDGDVVTMEPCTMAERGSIVLASADKTVSFRRFLPKVEGKVEGAILRAINDDYPDIEMRKGDHILARLKEHVSTRSS